MLILMTFAVRLHICGIASRNFISNSMGFIQYIFTQQRVPLRSLQQCSHAVPNNAAALVEFQLFQHILFLLLNYTTFNIQYYLTFT